MYSLYNSMKILRNVYLQLTETALREGKPLAYTDDPLMQSIIDCVTENKGETEEEE